jgi:NADH-quinone oxidoreductase subunit L
MAPIIILIPLVMFLVLSLGSKWLSPRVAGLLGTTGMAASTILAYTVAWNYFFTSGSTAAVIDFAVEWLRFNENLHIDLGVLLDPVSVMMLVVITTVSLMVHLYSLGYMKGERGFQRYYGLLSLFSFSMLGLVVATNIFQMYIFWELVGASSYLLIGFYFTKPSAVAASKKAFIVTRFADLGFLIGILILSSFTGTFDFGVLTADNAGLAVSSMAGSSFLGLSAATWAMGLLFMGGAGKSAMFPLHIWLPDAMEGPTPVSALIHAATMVVAGVFLVARMFPVYVFAAPDVLTLITYVGAFTALFAAIIAITQTDIKRVLAFSTISQIAYMMVALGVSGIGGTDGEGYTSSMFHLFTHAFFKALLFLGAGAVIHAVHSNEMGQMGGLRRYMPITHITFLIACLSIAGMPPFSGFFSKDGILAAAFHHDKIIFVVMLFVAGLTAFYMFRLYFRIFWGADRKYEHPPHEAPATMTIPLMVLAVFTCVTGFIPFAKFVSPDGVPYVMHINWAIAASGVGIGLVGIITATIFYRRQSDLPARVRAVWSGFWNAASNKFYLDEVWMFVTRKIIFGLVSTPIAWFDKRVVDGTMDALGTGTECASDAISPMQSGKVQTYAIIFVLAVLAITVAVFML